MVEMVLDARICGQKWFWWHESVGRNGSVGTNLWWIETVLGDRISVDRNGTVLGARAGFFLESVTSWVLAFDRSGDRIRNPSGTPNH